MKFNFTIILLMIMLSACSVIKKTKDNTVQQGDIVDITVPPTIGTDTARREKENTADETISFEQWNKERLEQTPRTN